MLGVDCLRRARVTANSRALPLMARTDCVAHLVVSLDDVGVLWAVSDCDTAGQWAASDCDTAGCQTATRQASGLCQTATPQAKTATRHASCLSR